MSTKHIDTLHKPFGLKCSAFIYFLFIFGGIPLSLWFGSFGVWSISEGNYPSITYNSEYNMFILSNHFKNTEGLLIYIFTPLLIFTLLWIPVWFFTARNNISSFVLFFKEKNINNPAPSNTVKSFMGSQYFSLDTKKGTLLFISHVETSFISFFYPRDIRVLGFGMNDWKSVEVQGNTLTIYTGNPELPSVSVTTGKASQLYEKINAMRHQVWTYENNIPGYVEHHAARIAARKGINLILPPN